MAYDVIRVYLPATLPLLALLRQCGELAPYTSDGHEVVARVDGEARVERGETVGLSFRREHVHLFDGESGAAL